NPYKMRQGIQFISDRIGDAPVSDRLSPAITDTVDEENWPHFWGELIRLRNQDRDLLSIGRDWLRGREERPEWTYRWSRRRSARPQAILPRASSTTPWASASRRANQGCLG